MAGLLRLRLERVVVRGTVDRHLFAIEASHFIESALSRLSPVYLPIDPSRTATSKPGVFAIGDVVTYPGKLKLILTGFAEAAIAARSAYALVHPETDRKSTRLNSSHLGISYAVFCLK